jgi:peptidoglycan/LPS O-acetylase OafA/YrhL
MAAAAASDRVPRVWWIAAQPVAGYVFGISALNVAIVVLIDFSIRDAKTMSGRLLNARPAVALGLISYAVYLWQQLFFTGDPGAIVKTFPINILLTLALATGSYFLLERPLARQRKALSRV